ncbi:unnamed protein product [Gongylonema pulchrum]|uniref:Transthyretin-like family protein n=1 Tax=Gongylonema pulchrum TaxID=637853 RepID=A0A183DGB1_9BILA|nr:unnamed protein product [Gongylonema pulchrum]
MILITYPQVVESATYILNTSQQHKILTGINGSGNGLKLLLNIESYERVESCTTHFRTMSLPGLKILIYNQTDVPESSLEGVNVPPGYTMEIPFRMQKFLADRAASINPPF